MNTRIDSSEKASAKKDTPVEVASPMADDKTLKAAGALPERRRSVATVRMVKDKNALDVSALDVEAHARMGWKLAVEAA